MIFPPRTMYPPTSTMLTLERPDAVTELGISAGRNNSMTRTTAIMVRIILVYVSIITVTPF